MKQRFTSIFDMKVKKKGIMLFAVVLVATLMAGMLVSCATVADGTNTPPPSSSENQTTKDTTTQEEPNTQTGTTGSNTSPTIKTDSGSYVGQADNNENGKFEEYYDLRVQYVGNNSEVSHLLNLLGVGDLGEYTIALKTDKEPYGLTIQYSKLKNNGDKEKFKIMDRIDYAYFVLALIDNLNDVDVNYETVNYHLTMDEANKMVNGNIKDYGSSPEKLKKLYDILNPKD